MPQAPVLLPGQDTLFAKTPKRRLLEGPPISGPSLPVQMASGSGRRLFGRLAASFDDPERAPRRDPLLNLVHRITQGFNLAEYERARTLGYEAYLEEQLDAFALDDSALEARLAGYTTLAQSPKTLIETYIEDFTEPYYQFKGAAVIRSVHSKRQLLERMVEFWNDHFSMDQNKGDLGWVWLPENDRLVVRPNALGSFPTLLSGIAHNGAMLWYLDNWLNVRGAPQENYARELLELHTMGVRGGYTEVDVKEVAKCFTGWTLELNPNLPNYLRGVFVQGNHTVGPKSVLGETIPNFPPREDAQRVLDLLVAHPSTAEFLARKLLRWFLSPEPPEALVSAVASTYLATNGDVKAMLRVILARENMAWAAPVRRPKFRRPFHLVTSLLRALDAEVSDALYPIFYLTMMGHTPFDHVQPDGYPDTVAAWGNSLLPRWRFATDLLGPAAVFGTPMPGVSLSYATIAARVGFGGASDRPGLARRIDESLFGQTLTLAEVEALQEFIDDFPGAFGAPALLETIGLGACLPGTQWT